MRGVKSKDTKPELAVRKLLFSKGYRFRLHVKKLPGTPDIVLAKYRSVIFVHGCFWHGHSNCEKATIPKTRTEWWANKIQKNIINDQKAIKALKKQGWHVLIVWTCEKPDHWQDYLLRSLKNKL